MKNLFFRIGDATILLIAFALILAFVSCTPGDDYFKTSEVLSRVNGTFTSSHGEKYEITAETFEYTSSVKYEGVTYNTTLIGNVCYKELLNNGYGIIYYQYTENSSDTDLVGKFCATAFCNVTDLSAQFSNAYKSGGVSATDSLAEAINEFTIPKGYFGYFGDFARVK